MVTSEMSISNIFTPYEKRLQLIPRLVSSGGPESLSKQHTWLQDGKRMGCHSPKGVCFIPPHLLVLAHQKCYPTPTPPHLCLYLQYIHCRMKYRHSFSTNISWHVITSPLLNLITALSIYWTQRLSVRLPDCLRDRPSK